MSPERADPSGQAPGEAAPRKKKKKKKRNIFLIILSLIGKLILAVFTLCLIAVLTVAIFARYFLSYVETTLAPSVSELEVEDMTMSLASTIYCKDESGEWVPLRVIYETGGNRELVEYEDLPDHLIKAVVAIEDKRFWEHNGVDWLSTAGSIRDTLLGGGTRGGSTITQQMLRNLSNRPEDKEVTVLRKFREIIRALEFEKTHAKEEILTLYLNKVNFGHAEGIGMAAKVYFGKSVSELDLAESAAIIAITNNPSLYDPFFDIEYEQSDGSIKTPRDFNKKRQTDILWTMKEQGIIDEATYNAALNEFLMFTDTPEYAALHAGEPEETEGEEGETVDETPQSTESGVVALHKGTYTWFEDAVIDDAIELIMEQQGVTRSTAIDKLYGGGYHIYTTLDLRIQEIVDSVYEDPSNFDCPSESGQPLASAISVVDPYTGDVLAMAGGVGVKTVSRAQNLARTPRQVGSSIKPVSVYAPAIDAGVIGPASIIDDYPIRINESGTGGYPKDDSGYYRGYVTVTQGVQSSLNCVAVRVLQKLGVARSFEFMENNLGFDLSTSDLDISPLAMGGLHDGLTTEQMAAAFSAFVNEGIYNKPRTILRIESNDHTEVVVDNENPDVPRTWVAMKKSTAYFMNTLLKRAANSGTGGDALFDGMTIAGKTGTTDKKRTRYFSGYTPYYAAAVWVGYKDKDETVNASGNPAAKIWRKVMQQIHEGLEEKPFFDKPEGISSVTLCKECGLLASDLCSQCGGTVSGEVPDDAVPSGRCNCHVELRLCHDETTDTYSLAGPYCPEDHIVTRVVSNSREFLMLGDSWIQVSDQEDQYAYWQMAATQCTIHDENFVPEDPNNPDGGEVLPGDPNYVPPDWLWGDDPDTPDEPGQTEEPTWPETPDIPEIPPDDETTSPNSGGAGFGGAQTGDDTGGTTPDEPQTGGEPSAPDEPVDDGTQPPL